MLGSKKMFGSEKKQAQICAEGCEGENFSQILCKYCTNIVKF